MTAPRFLVSENYLAGTSDIRPRDGDVVCDLSSRDVAVYIHPHRKLPTTDPYGRDISLMPSVTSETVTCETFVCIPKAVTAMVDLWKKTVEFELAMWRRWGSCDILYELVGTNPTVAHLVGGSLNPHWTLYVRARIRWESWFAEVVFDTLDTGRVMGCGITARHRNTVRAVCDRYEQIRTSHVFVEVDAELVSKASKDVRDKFDAFLGVHVTNAGYRQGEVPISERNQLDKLFHLLPQLDGVPPPVQHPVDKMRYSNGDVTWYYFAMFRWPYYYEQVRDTALAMCDSGLPPYCLLWIFNWLPDMHRWPDSRKIACIERVFASAQRVRGRQLYIE